MPKWKDRVLWFRVNRFCGSLGGLSPERRVHCLHHFLEWSLNIVLLPPCSFLRRRVGNARNALAPTGGCFLHQDLFHLFSAPFPIPFSPQFPGLPGTSTTLERGLAKLPWLRAPLGGRTRVCLCLCLAHQRLLSQSGARLWWRLAEGVGKLDFLFAWKRTFPP